MNPETDKSHREKQYDTCLRLREKQGLTRLGSMANWAWHDDPRRLTWLLARYKFVSKMLSGCNTALEVGCADAFASRVVLQEVPNLKVIDFDPIFIDEVKDKWTRNGDSKRNITIYCRGRLNQEILMQHLHSM